MRAAFRRRWHAFVAGRQRASVAAPHSARSLENRDFCRRSHAYGLCCTDASGRSDGRRMLPRLGRADAGADLAPGDIIVMDNLAATRSSASGKLSRPLAPNSAISRLQSDLNPIENAFAKLKAHVRKSAARTSTHLSEPPPMRCHSSNLTNVLTSSRTQDT